MKNQIKDWLRLEDIGSLDDEGAMSIEALEDLLSSYSPHIVTREAVLEALSSSMFEMLPGDRVRCREGHTKQRLEYPEVEAPTSLYFTTTKRDLCENRGLPEVPGYHAVYESEDEAVRAYRGRAKQFALFEYTGEYAAYFAGRWWLSEASPQQLTFKGYRQKAKAK